MFEELVNAWLDELEDAESPGGVALRTGLDEAITQQPALGPVLAQWTRLHELIQAALPAPETVCWEDFRAQLAIRLSSAA